MYPGGRGARHVKQANFVAKLWPPQLSHSQSPSRTSPSGCTVLRGGWRGMRAGEAAVFSGRSSWHLKQSWRKEKTKAWQAGQIQSPFMLPPPLPLPPLWWWWWIPRCGMPPVGEWWSGCWCWWCGDMGWDMCWCWCWCCCWWWWWWLGRMGGPGIGAAIPIPVIPVGRYPYPICVAACMWCMCTMGGGGKGRPEEPRAMPGYGARPRALMGKNSLPTTRTNGRKKWKHPSGGLRPSATNAWGRWGGVGVTVGTQDKVEWWVESGGSGCCGGHNVGKGSAPERPRGER